LPDIFKKRLPAYRCGLVSPDMLEGSLGTITESFRIIILSGTFSDGGCTAAGFPADVLSVVLVSLLPLQAVRLSKTKAPTGIIIFFIY
jgi:hypothetical protein